MLAVVTWRAPSGPATSVLAYAALTAADRARGYRGADPARPPPGMLFLWRRGIPTGTTLTMAGVRLPLDAALLDPKGRVVAVWTLTPGQDPLPLPQGLGAVLEVPGGTASVRGLAPGALVTWPPHVRAVD